MRTQGGSLIFFINGHRVGVAATNLPTQLYGIVDLYGQCAGVKITNGTPPVDSNAPLHFHTLCGENVLVSEDRMTASRVQAYEEFTKSTVFTSRPLRPNELLQVAVEVIVDNWSGSLQLGKCSLERKGGESVFLISGWFHMAGHCVLAIHLVYWPGHYASAVQLVDKPGRCCSAVRLVDTSFLSFPSLSPLYPSSSSPHQRCSSGTQRMCASGLRSWGWKSITRASTPMRSLARSCWTFTGPT